MMGIFGLILSTVPLTPIKFRISGQQARFVASAWARRVKNPQHNLPESIAFWKVKAGENNKHQLGGFFM